jgi:hypothetical protein
VSLNSRCVRRTANTPYCPLSSGIVYTRFLLGVVSSMKSLWVEDGGLQCPDQAADGHRSQKKPVAIFVRFSPSQLLHTSQLANSSNLALNPLITALSSELIQARSTPYQREPTGVQTSTAVQSGTRMQPLGWVPFGNIRTPVTGTRPCGNFTTLSGTYLGVVSVGIVSPVIISVCPVYDSLTSQVVENFAAVRPEDSSRNRSSTG